MARLGLIFALGLGSVTWSSAVDAADSPHVAWAGRWALDDDASDPPGKMLEAMEVPWYLKAIALAFTPKLEIEPDGEGLFISSETPFGARRERFSGDGSERRGEDVLGRAFRETSRWSPEGFLLVHRETELPSGAIARVDSTWSLAGRTLNNDLRIRVGDESPFPLRRVFERQGSEVAASEEGDAR